jgi:hypothetical protein
MPMISDCKKLIIELSLFDRKKEVFSIVQSNSTLTEEYINEMIIDRDSFFSGKSGISFEKKKLLAVVYHKLFKAVINKVSIEDYVISLSHAYFCFLNENDEMIFSSPHITSPIIFNPNDTCGTYTLIPSGWGPRGKNNYSNICKRKNAKIAVFDYEQADPYGNGDVARYVITTAPKQNITVHDIVNSLFDYYITETRQDNAMSSYYKDVSANYDICFISQFELQKFRYINDKQ